MRQRKVKNLETKYDVYDDILVYKPEEMKGNWTELAEGKPVYLEIGCGKGKFISELAAREPENFFVAVEGNRSVMLRAMEKINENELENVVFIPEFIEDLTDWFEDSEVAGIYLNFSDPHPKHYTRKKRLTYRDRLKQYFTVLKNDGILTFKTDNTGLFEFTLQELKAANLKIVDITRDLHASGCTDNIETEYEAKFSGLGEKIKRVVLARAEDKEMENVRSMAALNGRDIPKEDKVFGASSRAKAMAKEKGADAVINATIGSLLDDNGELVVLSSVNEAVQALHPSEYAEYAPIAGTPGFKEAIKKATFGNYEPNSFVRVVATPGGTGAIRNTIANYSCYGDKILTHCWHWAPYKSIANEMGRGLEHFDMFDEAGKFNLTDFEYKVNKLLRNQEHLVIILNTPANNPTGYSLTEEDWYGIKAILDQVDMEKKVALLVDVAYIDFAGETDETRVFLPIIDNLRSNVLPIIAYSASKTFTFYGFRCAAMMCLAHYEDIAEEFERVCTFSSRASWSNSPKAPQTVIEHIYANPELLARVDEERAEYRDMLLARGRAFEEEAKKVGLEIVPFSSGFFVSIPSNQPDALCAALEKKGVFLVPLALGVRVSVASIAEDKCRKLPAIIKETIDELK
ncbi:MAG: tRNA (guanosine(46)-N7)-methyltransferase TrmB [Firmicutes bacterium]|nr:tRNA (guanosine(46)-N7)-methyltransferase TrmB [Bacillota bacterium]